MFPANAQRIADGVEAIMKNKHLLLALVIFLLCMTASAAIAADIDIGFSWTVEGRTVTVNLTPSSGKHYALYLPGVCRSEALTVTVRGRGSVLWGGRLIGTGDSIDLRNDIGKTVEVNTPDGRQLNLVSVMQGSLIPSVFIELAPKDIRHIDEKRTNDIRQDGLLTVLNNDGSLLCTETVTSFHLRGHTTRHALKRPYQMKLKHKQAIGGMPASKTWLLLANWYDVSLLRNQITLNLCREMGLKGTPRGMQTDVYLNGVYNGVYYLCEKLQIRSSRLDITDMEKAQDVLNTDPSVRFRLQYSRKYGVPLLRWHTNIAEPEDITGGFLLELEKKLQFSENVKNGGFITDGDLCVIINEPTRVGFRAANYIASLVNDFHNAAIAKDGFSPKTGRYYADFIDMDSFAAKIIVEEISCNFDVKAASQFIYKDADSKNPLLYAGPGWDYDLTYGNKTQKTQHDPTRLNYVSDRSSATSNLYGCLLKHDDFARRTRTLFIEKAIPALEILLGNRPAPEGSNLRSIDSWADEIRASARMNFARWSTGLIIDLYKPSGVTFDDAVAYLKNFILLRKEALDGGWLVQ